MLITTLFLPHFLSGFPQADENYSFSLKQHFFETFFPHQWQGKDALEQQELFCIICKFFKCDDFTVL